MAASDRENIRVVKISKTNLSQAQSLLFHAYYENEFAKALLGAKSHRYGQRLRAFIRESLLQHYAQNNLSLAIASGDKLIGVAAVSQARQQLKMASSWRWRLAMYSVAGVLCTHRLMRYFRGFHRALDRSGESYWISLIGLHPDYQGKGYGQLLVEAIHEECQANKQASNISIDTCAERDKRFFESMGYAKTAELDGHGLRTDLLVRYLSLSQS